MAGPCALSGDSYAAISRKTVCGGILNGWSLREGVAGVACEGNKDGIEQTCVIVMSSRLYRQ